MNKNEPEQGEIYMKQWRLTEMERTGLSIGGVYRRLANGKYPQVRVRKVNPRVVFVRVEV